MIVLGINMTQLSRLMRKGAEEEPLRPVQIPELRVIEGGCGQSSPRISPARHRR